MSASAAVRRGLRRAKRQLQGVAPENGYFEGLTGSDLTGWCQSAGHGPIRLALYFGPHPIAEVDADIDRLDVAAGAGGAAACGFLFSTRMIEPTMIVLAASGHEAPEAFRVLTPTGARLAGATAAFTPAQFLDAAALTGAVGRLKASFNSSVA